MSRIQLDITYLKGAEGAGINPKLGLNPDFIAGHIYKLF
jgi:hypothetical protein